MAVKDCVGASMTFRIEPGLLPRYQAIAMVLLVLISILTVSGFFVFKSHLENSDRFASLNREVIAQQHARLDSEIQSMLQHIDYLRQEARFNLRRSIRDHVNQAWAVANSLYQQNRDRMSEVELQRLIRETLRDVRFFDGRGYLFIDHMSGRAVLLPTVPEREGTLMLDVRDDNGIPVMASLIEAVSNPEGEGFTSYGWYPPGQAVMREKVTFARRFDPFGWLIGTGDYLYRMEEDLKAMVVDQLSGQLIGGDGYFSVLTANGQVLSNPARPELEGLGLRDIESAKDRALIEDSLRAAAAGGGFIEYNPFDNPAEEGRVLALAQQVPGWDWVLVASLYPEDIRVMIESHSQSLSEMLADNGAYLLVAAGLGTLLTLMVALFFSHFLKSGFRRYQQDIDHQQEQLAVAARVFEAAREGILVTGPDNTILAVNEAFCRISGYNREEAVGQNPRFMSSGAHSRQFYDQLWQELDSSGRWQGEVWNRRKDGSLVPEWLSISVCYGADSEVLNYIATVSDLSDHKRTEERLRYLAEHDSLTGLPNRLLLAERVEQALAQVRRYGGKVALLHLDIDRFRDINDSLGHTVGDQVLLEVGQRLTELVGQADTVARLGGDEFAILMSAPMKPEEIASVVKRLLENLVRSLSVDTDGLEVTPGVGIAVFPGDGDDFESLLRNADTALRHAKQVGRDNFQFFTTQMNAQVSERLLLETDLRHAVRNQEFELYYQPQYCLNSASPQGCEALIRWNHPQRGVVGPMAFIPLAEENGLILPIGEWVINKACQQGAQWISDGYLPVSVAVNVSACQFAQDLVSTIQQALLESDFPAQLLVVEVTESVLMGDVEQAQETLSQLQEMGVKIALDDFGTGYSSLSYLKRFPLDKLKIDRAFTAGLPLDPDDTALTSSIIDIARNLQLSTIAEGVETSAQRDFLKAAGCDVGQGYFYAKPVPAAEFTQLLAKRENARVAEPLS